MYRAYDLPLPFSSAVSVVTFFSSSFETIRSIDVSQHTFINVQWHRVQMIYRILSNDLIISFRLLNSVQRANRKKKISNFRNSICYVHLLYFESILSITKQNNTKEFCTRTMELQP